MKFAKLGVLLVVCLALFQYSALAAHEAAEDAAPQADFTVHLQSRTFTPAAGIEPTAVHNQGVRSSGLNADTATRYLYVQFNALPTPLHQSALAERGLQLLEYIPSYTWLAAVSPELNLSDPNLDIRWVGVPAAADKLSPNLRHGQLTPAKMTPNGRAVLQIFTYSPDTLDQLAARVASFDGDILSQNAPSHSLEVALDPAHIWPLAAEGLVSWIEQDVALPSVNNDQARTNAGVDAVHATPYNLTGAGVALAIFDGGAVDHTHPDFDSRVTVQTTRGVSNHATHVAGTLVGSGANSQTHGFQPGELMGMAPDATLFSFYFGEYKTHAEEAIDTLGATILNNSWGFNSCSYAGGYSSHGAFYDEMISSDVYSTRPLVVFSAGNQTTRCEFFYGTVMWGPASAKNILTVGSIQSDDSQLARLTGIGPTDDGRIKPELVAAGDQSDTLDPDTGQILKANGILSTLPSGNYGTYTGTSMATPVVAGSLALLQEQFPLSCPSQTPLPATYRGLLVHSATDLTPSYPENQSNAAYNGYQIGPDYPSGFGRLNVPAAVDLIPYTVSGSVAQAEIKRYTLPVDGSQPLKVTLVWDDPSAASGAAITLINDLNLELIAPDGSVFGPWLLDPTNPSSPATRPSWPADGSPQRDERNVIEQVVVDSPQAGQWTIQVRGDTIPQGPQSFSLISEALGAGCGSFSLDAPPAVRFDGNLGSQTLSGTVEIAIAASDSEDAPGTLQVDFSWGDEWIPASYDSTRGLYSVMWETTSVPHNFYTLSARATDSQDQTALVTLENVPVDNSQNPPSVAFFGMGLTNEVSGYLPVALQASDSEDSGRDLTVEVRLGENGDWLATSYNVEFQIYFLNLDTTLYPDGRYTLWGRALDQDGNEASVSIENLQVENVNEPPTVTFISPGENETVGGVELIQLAAGDAESPVGELTVELAFDDNDWISPVYNSQSGWFEWAWNTTQLQDASYSLHARVSDPGGETTAVTLSGLMVDNIDLAPEISFISPGANSLLGGRVSIEISASDFEDASEALSVSLSIDGHSWQPLTYGAAEETFTTSWDTASLPDGPYRLQARVEDSAGHLSSAVLPVEIKNLLSVSMVQPTPNSIVSGTVEIQVAASQFNFDPVQQGLEIQIGQLSWQPMVYSTESGLFTYAWDSTAVANGEYALSFRTTQPLAGVSSYPVFTLLVENQSTYTLFFPTIFGGAGD